MAMNAIAQGNLESEKKVVKDDMRAELKEGDKWFVIDSKWFAKWKLYVDFDGQFRGSRSLQEVESLKPPMIGSIDLRGSNPEVLKPNLFEGQDYVLLPANSANALILKYKANPYTFCRVVVNMGSAENKLLQIELYPVELYFYTCTKDKPTVGPNDTPALLLVSKKEDVSTFISRRQQQQNIKVGTRIRVWLKTSELPEALPAGNLGGRLMTSDVTDREGSWMLIRNVEGLKMADLLDDQPNLTIILEYYEVPFVNTNKDTSPRAQFLNAWKKSITVGDMIDVEDKTKKWREAVVTKISDDGCLSVHFKGYISTNDEKILKSEINDRVAPLNTKTVGWRTKRLEDSSIDINIEEPGFAVKWVTGVVQEVNLVTSKVKVEVNKSEWDDYQYNKISDDDAKKAIASVAVDDDIQVDPVSNSNSVANNSSDATNTGQARWVDLYGDDICPLNTHTKKPISTYGTGLPSSSYAVTTTRYSAGSSYYNRDDEYGDKNQVGKPIARGVVGLQNLGNTCFMNSVLQCMSNTEPLTQYFLDNRYKDEINTDNVLGHSGKVALAYAKLIKDMWSDSFTKVVPRVFKKTIGEFQPQFAGYQQQDSQELMGFLLDGLHEDLNRRLKKPAVSKIESNGRPDELIARESWRRFLLRNDSAIVDCVYGQLRSHVTCLCGKQSVTFDPFNTLSLPVPVKTSRPITVIIRLLPPESIPLKIIVEVEPNDQIKDLRTRVLARLHALGRLPHYIGKGSHANLSALAVESKPTNLHSAMIEEDEEGYIKVNHVPELPPPSSSSSSSSTVDQMYTEVHYTRYMAAKSRGEPTPPEFHVIKLNQLGTAGPTIDKTLTDKAPVGDLTRLKDEVGLFQLPYPCIVQENTYRYDYSKKTSSLEANSFVYVLDLYIGVEDRNAYNYGNSNLAKRIKIEGYPYRLLLTTKMTGRDLYSKVEEYTRRFVLPGSSFYNNRENLPFIIMTTSIYSPSYARDLVADDDTVLDISPDSNALVAVWKNEADNKANFDQVEFIKVDVLLMEDDLTVAGDDDDSSMNVVTSEPNIVSPSSSSSSSTAVAVSVSESSAKVISDESISNSARNSINDDSASGRKRKKSSGLTIYKCLDKFCEREQLNEEETLYCSQCKQHVAPVKKMDLWATPDILTVQLKRFQYIPGQYFVHREKINDFIDFPVDGLDLTQYVKGPQNPSAPPIYDLYAVSLHSGGLGGGHYTAVAKNATDGKWYNFNDSYVSETTAESAVSEQSYVLFYKRKTGALRWAGLEPLPDPGLPDDE